MFYLCGNTLFNVPQVTKMERGKIYLDDDGDEIIYNWDGTITISRDGIVPEGGNFKDFEEFKKEQDKGDINYLDSLEYYEDLDPLEPDVPSLILTQNEAVCLAVECSKPHILKQRPDQHDSVAHIHGNVTYTFLDWNSTTPTKLAANEEWLRTKHEKMVCILSVSLAKRDSSANNIDDTRRTMLINAIYAWQKHGWAVLLFIPSHNRGQYEHCARIKSMFDNEAVNIVPYSIEQGTCNVSMNVGESRNAILHFLNAWKHIITVCTMADERVESVLRPLPILSNAGYSGKDENVGIKEQRIKEGYDRLSVINMFLRIGTDSRSTFIEEQRKSDVFWASQSTRDTKFCRSVCALYDKLLIEGRGGKEDKITTETSIYHQLKTDQPTLVCFPQNFRWFMQKTEWRDLPNPRGRYKHWGKSAGGKFLGGDQSPLAPSRLTMPTQLITFKVGQGGWDGQFYYPFTTIGEDNFFSYEWTKEIGEARQVNAVQIIRKFPRAAVSITRRPDDVTTYTPCAIKELMFILNSETYYQRNPNELPKIKWTVDYDPSPLSMPCYKWQAFIFCQIPAEVDRRSKLSLTDRIARPGMVVTDKVRHICDRLLTFILSKKFREPKYFKAHSNQIYNNMIDVIRKNQTKYVQDLGLQFPENK